MDAYSKISIGYNGAVTQKRTDNQGVRHILGTDTGDVQIEMPGQKRVLIKYAGREAGRQGAMKGDVVTHIADESIAGKTASAALIMANNFKQRGHYNLTLILNAERSVAEALKRRALAIAET
jgi:UDP-N-acetyl-D-mannosaminuronate dehydrogenase